MKPEAITRTWTVRGYEVDGTRTTPLPQVLSYLEQLRWEWIADPDWGLDVGVHDGHFFVVRRQILELVERPRFGDALTISGAIQKVGRSQVLVRHRLSVDGRAVGHALVTGIWLGPNRRLARLPEKARALGRAQAESDGPFGSLPGAESDTVLPATNERSFFDAPRQVFQSRGLDLSLPEALSGGTLHPITVRPSDCDVFQHVNASKWLDYIDDARLAAGHTGVANRVAIDYAAEALAGETLDVECAVSGTGLIGARVTRGDTLLCTATVGVPSLRR